MTAPTLRALSADECRGLLRAGGIGRVGVSLGALPAIFPIRFALNGHAIEFRVASGTPLADAVTNTVVAFEADSIDDRGEGWSVLVVGRAAMVEASDLETTRHLPLEPWSSEHDQLVCIPAQLISGREIGGAAGV